jgi:hypothetical protein
MFRQIVEKFDSARTGSIARSDRPEVMKAIMRATGWNQQKRIASLLAQFPSKKAVERAFWLCLDEFFEGRKVSRV